MVRREFDGGPAFLGPPKELFRLSGGQPGDTPAIREAQERQRLAGEAARKARADALRAIPRAFADLRQFPRPGYATDYAREHGAVPWARESLTRSEARGGSIFGFGLVDNPVDTSPGEKRAKFAFFQNEVRASVRRMMDEGKTDAEIKASLGTPTTLSGPLAGFAGTLFETAFPGITHNGVVDPVPTDIRRRFNL